VVVNYGGELLVNYGGIAKWQNDIYSKVRDTSVENTCRLWRIF